jgi:hypothetical protein
MTLTLNHHLISQQTANQFVKQIKYAKKVEPENARDHQFTAFISSFSCVAAHHVSTF